MTAPPLRAVDLAVVSVGGALGSLVRWLIDSAFTTRSMAWDVPWDIVAINVLGAFALGVLPAWGVVRRSHRATLLLGPGLLGGFTTVSAWVDGTRQLAQQGDVASVALLVGVTLLAGLGAARLGRHLAHRPEPADAFT